MTTLLTITGASASGKTELLKRLVATGKVEKLVSHTTRPMRPGEEEGVDYYFRDKDWFDQESDAGNFFQELNFSGNRYGTHKSEMERVMGLGKIPAVIVEPFGVHQFVRTVDDDVDVFKIFLEVGVDIAFERFLSRIPAEDIDNPERLEYHAKRMVGIVEEVQTWSRRFVYDLVLNNNSRDPHNLDALTQIVLEETS